MEIFNIILPIICLTFGFYAGFKIGKEKEVPKVPESIKHPIKEAKNNKENKKAEEELEEIQANLKALDDFSAGM